MHLALLFLLLTRLDVHRRTKNMSWFRKKRIPEEEMRPFVEFVSSESLGPIRTATNAFPPLKRENITYIVFQVRDDTSEEVERHLTDALEVVRAHEGIIEKAISSIVLVVFSSNSDMRSEDAQIVIQKMGPNVRAIYGHGNFLRGAIGIAGYFSYGTVFP